MTKHTVVIGDSRRMAEVMDSSVHLIITSPPYWQLKDYGSGRQIGYNDSYADYINNLNIVWNECHRVLHDGCRLCVNIGDQFARSVYYGGYRIIPIRTEIIKFCEVRGFDYMGAIIWQKVTSVNTTGGGTVMGSYPYPRNGIVKIDYEFILIFKKPGKAPAVSRGVKEDSKLTKAEWNEYFSGHWRFSGARQSSHLAVFPPELPKRLIRMFSFIGENVLDPFLGSGTTALAALEHSRNSVGYEINREFLPMIKRKLGLDQTRIDASNEFELVYQQRQLRESELEDLIGSLPYRYENARTIERTVDPKVRRFGQKIDGTADIAREEYHRVVRIVSPEVLELESGSGIRLIGVRDDGVHTKEAVRFLKDLLRGNRIYLRFEKNRQYDDEQNLLCYLYLKNRTFVNAHMIRSGLVAVDGSWDYGKRAKFLNLSGTNKI